MKPFQLSAFDLLDATSFVLPVLPKNMQNYCMFGDGARIGVSGRGDLAAVETTFETKSEPFTVGLAGDALNRWLKLRVDLGDTLVTVQITDKAVEFVSKKSSYTARVIPLFDRPNLDDARPIFQIESGQLWGAVKSLSGFAHFDEKLNPGKPELASIGFQVEGDGMVAVATNSYIIGVREFPDIGIAEPVSLYVGAIAQVQAPKGSCAVSVGLTEFGRTRLDWDGRTAVLAGAEWKIPWRNVMGVQVDSTLTVPIGEMAKIAAYAAASLTVEGKKGRITAGAEHGTDNTPGCTITIEDYVETVSCEFDGDNDFSVVLNLTFVQKVLRLVGDSGSETLVLSADSKNPVKALKFASEDGRSSGVIMPIRVGP